jgi:hypothetical protein
MTPLLGYLICGAVFAVVSVWLYHVIRVRPMREAHAQERRRLQSQLAAVAGEQMMLRERGPLTQRTPTIRG